MAKCKVCGYRLGDGVTKCPMCGALEGSTVAGEVSPQLNLPKYACPACKAQIIGEHRYCTTCGADLKKAVQTAQNTPPAQENKCVQCGATLPAGAKFCSECGARQDGQTSQPVQQNVHTQKNVMATAQAHPSQSANVTSTAAVTPSATANVTTSGTKETPLEAFEYEIRDGKYILTRLKDKSLTEVVIPRIFSEIGWQKDYKGNIHGAFQDCFNLTSVYIPDSITEIGINAFCNIRVSSGNFQYTNNLTTVNIPSSVTKIGRLAFWGCRISSVVIPESVTEIGWGAFFCGFLTNVTIMNPKIPLKEIEDAFSGGCWGLKTITIGNKTMRVRHGPFSVMKIKEMSNEKNKPLKDLIDYDW